MEFAYYTIFRRAAEQDQAAVVAKGYQFCYNARMKNKVILRDGVFVHEADALCWELEQADVPFEMWERHGFGNDLVGEE